MISLIKSSRTPARRQATRLMLVLWTTLLLVCPLAAQENGTQWQVAEWTFTSATTYERSYEDVVLTCSFAGPEGRNLDVEGFYDGGNVWKVRFCPDRPGTWRWKTTCNRPDDTLNGKQGTIEISAASTKGNPLHEHGGILKVAENRRQLTYSDGTPFFWLGDTWWFCPGDKVPLKGSTNPKIDSMFKTLIAKRKEQGFTVVQWAGMGSFGYHGGPTQFMKVPQGGKFDHEYWRQFDRYVEIANDAGIVPVIGFGFHVGLDKQPLDELKFLWRYVVARYGASSISWLICGEYNSTGGDSANRIKKVLELGAFIKERDPYKRAMSVHPWYFGGDTKDSWNLDWYDFVLWQGGHVGHGSVPPTAKYEESAKLGKPYIQSETQYEGIYGGKPNEVTADDVRRSAWNAMQSGCCGFTYGANGLWYPTQNADDKTFAGDWGTATPWWDAMNYPGPDRLHRMKEFYEKRDWFRFRPAPKSLILEGNYSDATRPLLQVDDRHGMILYCPEGSGRERPIAVDTENGRYEVRWFNPRTGEETAAGTVDATGKRLTVPSRPDGLDWVLTLKKDKT